MEKLPDHETIEGAFRPARDMVDLMSDPTSKHRVEEHLKIAEDYVHRDRERAQTIDRDAPAEQMTLEMRGPALSGWPWPCEAAP